MKTRIYRIASIGGLDGPEWLVRATSQAQALRYVTHKHLRVEVATQEDLIELLTTGQQVKDGGKTPSDEGDEDADG